MIPGRTYDRVDSSTPPGLRLLQEFLNTLDEREFERFGERHRHEDLLGSPRDLADWLAARTVHPPGRPGPQEHERAIRLRAAIREVLAHRAGLPADLDGARSELSRYALAIAVTEDGELRLESREAGVGRVLGDLVASVARAAADGSLDRMRMCGSDECRWVFYDGSRSGRGRWCSMEPCGNRVKTRAYRRRRHAAA